MKPIAAVILLAFLLAACAPAAQPAPTATETPIPPTITNTLPPTSTKGPTKTATVTRTKIPTHTPRPTATRTPIPEPVVFEGTGDDILDLDLSWNGPALVEFEYTGRSNFIAVPYDANNDRMGSLANEIGAYNGRTLLNISDGDDAKRISVESSGPWKITIYPLSVDYLHSCRVPGICSGTSDDIIYLTGETPDLLKAEYTGDSNFIVHAYADYRRSMINEIGAYTGTVMVPSDTILIGVESSGDWTFDISAK